MRPPAAPSVGFGTDTVFVTALNIAFGYSRFNRTICESCKGSGAKRIVLPCTATSVTPASRQVCRNLATASRRLTGVGGWP